MLIKKKGSDYTTQQKSALKLSSIVELKVLHDGIRFLQSRRYSLSLEVSQLSPQQTRLWQQKLNRNFFACGCEVGAAFMLIVIGTCLVLSFAQPGGLMMMQWAYFFVMVIAIILSALTGKIVGLAIAHIQFKRDIKELIHQLE